MTILVLLISFVLGSIFGSLFNVLIYRLPRGESVVYPNSRCPHCGHRIKPYENIPILSYIFLKGKCSACKNKISIRYPIVEALTGFYFSLCVYAFYIKNNPDLSILNIKDIVKTIEAVLFGSILIVQSFIDLDWFILLDSFNYGGILLGLLFSLTPYGFVDIKSSILGILFGGLLPFLIYYIYLKVRKMEGLGIGDIKLLAMIGAFGGVYMVLGAMFFGSVIGLLVSIPTILKNKNMQYYIPFGPFLSMGAILWMFFGKVIERVLWT
ncbi:MAG: prepilin peptidase [Hydrogenobaculum sp.]|nr:MAG: prepilin peptidase [Hydrogenobaculum sp.]PMP62319.1 MAG: prepilin peptidase [Hydrogenobaculum sp.]PMP90641.1 MAG: prepilin peptidase [Hydrogenobaculum sp.]